MFLTASSRSRLEPGWYNSQSGVCSGEALNASDLVVLSWRHEGEKNRCRTWSWLLMMLLSGIVTAVGTCGTWCFASLSYKGLWRFWKADVGSALRGCETTRLSMKELCGALKKFDISYMKWQMARWAQNFPWRTPKCTRGDDDGQQHVLCFIRERARETKSGFVSTSKQSVSTLSWIFYYWSNQGLLLSSLLVCSPPPPCSFYTYVWKLIALSDAARATACLFALIQADLRGGGKAAEAGRCRHQSKAKGLGYERKPKVKWGAVERKKTGRIW